MSAPRLRPARPACAGAGAQAAMRGANLRLVRGPLRPALSRPAVRQAVQGRLARHVGKGLRQGAGVRRERAQVRPRAALLRCACCFSGLVLATPALSPGHACPHPRALPPLARLLLRLPFALPRARYLPPHLPSTGVLPLPRHLLRFRPNPGATLPAGSGAAAAKAAHASRAGGSLGSGSASPSGAAKPAAAPSSNGAPAAEEDDYADESFAADSPGAEKPTPAAADVYAAPPPAAEAAPAKTDDDGYAEDFEPVRACGGRRGGRGVGGGVHEWMPYQPCCSSCDSSQLTVGPPARCALRRTPALLPSPSRWTTMRWLRRRRRSWTRHDARDVVSGVTVHPCGVGAAAERSGAPSKDSAPGLCTAARVGRSLGWAADWQAGVAGGGRLARAGLLCKGTVPERGRLEPRLCAQERSGAVATPLLSVRHQSKAWRICMQHAGSRAARRKETQRRKTCGKRTFSCGQLSATAVSRVQLHSCRRIREVRDCSQTTVQEATAAVHTQPQAAPDAPHRWPVHKTTGWHEVHIGAPFEHRASIP
jgi:hypothetical protein